jgi:predicted  nucleic acid-binding Zn-ribbon protein
LKLIDRLFGKKQSSPSGITFDDLPEWLESRSRKISEEIGGEASSHYSGIREALSAIKESMVALEEATPEGRFHLKMVKVATSNRDNMSKQVRMLLENINIPQATDIAAIMAFHENAIQTLTVCLENMMKSYQYTKLVYFEESKELIAKVNALGRRLNELIEPVDNKRNVLDALNSAKTTIQNIKNLNLDIVSNEKTLKESEEKIAFLKKELEEKEKALTLLRESEPWKRYIKSREELISLEADAGKKEAEIRGLILPLNKALGRLKQLSDSGRYTLTPEIKDGLNSCLSGQVNVNPEFFIEFRKIVESGVLNLAPEKTNKILEQTKLVHASLDSLKEEYQALTQDIEKQKEKISGLKAADEEAELEKRIVDLKDKTTSLEKELELSRNRVEFLKHDVESKRLELQRCVSVIDSRMNFLKL